MNKNVLILFLIIVFYSTGYSQDKLAISPAYPVAGDKVIITYDPSAPGASIPDTVSGINLVFSYSNFFELPSKIALEKKGKLWQTSFIVPRYGVHATFTLQSGDHKDQPAPDKHYQVIVYDQNRKRLQNSYLYEGYSLSAQLGRSPSLAARQAALFEEELRHFPDNYEAKLKKIAYQVTQANETDKKKLTKKAEDIIAAYFHEKPGVSGRMNRTTMGYLIIGQNSRVDSIREVVRKEYPETEAGYDLRIDAIRRNSDTAQMVKQLEEILQKENASNANYLRDAHDALFQYYASQKQTSKALHHLSKLKNDNSPYKPETLKNQAAILLSNGIALDTAFALAQRSLALADTFPISLTRYFPETGYLPSYVSREERKASIKKVSGNLYSLLSLIRLKQGNKNEAASLIAKALDYSEDAETLANAGNYYQSTGAFSDAFQAYKKIAFENADDTISFRKMKENYLSWKGNDTGLDKEVSVLRDHWQKEITAELQKEIISLSSPDFIKNIVDLKGNPVSEDMMKNKITVLNFWATWCVPCMHEMHYMQNAYDLYKSDTNVVFMIVNSGARNELSDAQNWNGNKKYSFPVYYNTDRTIGEKLGFNLIPATYIIDANNRIRFKTLGFEGAVIGRKIPASIELLKTGM